MAILLIKISKITNFNTPPQTNQTPNYTATQILPTPPVVDKRFPPPQFRAVPRKGTEQQAPNGLWFAIGNVADNDRTKNDVLCNKGGYTNSWQGNLNYRNLVKSNYFKYKTTKRDDKLLISNAIVQQIRSQNPPGRFLQYDERSGAHFDIGDDAARSKTSQCFRDVNMNSAEMQLSEKAFLEEVSVDFI